MHKQVLVHKPLRTAKEKWNVDGKGSKHKREDKVYPFISLLKALEEKKYEHRKKKERKELDLGRKCKTNTRKKYPFGSHI